MAKYINLNKLVQDIDDSDEIEFSEILQLIYKQPTADVVEVVHGEWIEADIIEDEWIQYRCNKCDCTTDAYYKEKFGLHRYCPNCGAKMDGGREI